jgi:hypothetical protein
MGVCAGPCLEHCYNSNRLLYLGIGFIIGFIFFQQYQEKNRNWKKEVEGRAY